MKTRILALLGCFTMGMDCLADYQIPIALVFSMVMSLFLQITASFHQATYKSDLVLRYEDKYNDKLAEDRANAAKATLQFIQYGKWSSVTNEDYLDGLENVLAFYDELGFYWRHGEISTDVLYEHFYYDMRIYCQNGVAYIHENAKADSSADWENVEPLFNELTAMEARHTGKSIKACTWDAKTLKDSLDSEVRHEK